MRAASVVPSFNGINVCSMTRTVFGKFVTITATLQLGTVTRPSEAVSRYSKYDAARPRCVRSSREPSRKPTSYERSSLRASRAPERNTSVDVRRPHHPLTGFHRVCELRYLDHRRRHDRKLKTSVFCESI